MKKKIPKSIRKFIRREKTRIRREVSDTKKQEGLINELYQKLVRPSKTSPAGLSKKKPNTAKRVEVVLPTKKDEDKRNLQAGNK